MSADQLLGPLLEGKPRVRVPRGTWQTNAGTRSNVYFWAWKNRVKASVFRTASGDHLVRLREAA